MSTPTLSRRQTIRLVIVGALLWLGAALILRSLAPLGVYEGANRLLLYAAIVPGTWPFVLLIVWAAGISRAQALHGVAIALATALLLDGIALAWTPWLYGASIDDISAAGALILWGGGVFLVFGAIAARRG